MTKFTPGPWKQSGVEMLDSDRNVICLIVDASVGPVIASAPRMYELLAMTLDRIHEGPIDHISAEALIEDIRTTITSISVRLDRCTSEIENPFKEDN